MKGVFAAAALAAMTGAASAAHGHRHAHDLFAKRNNGTAETCIPGCTTYWTTITGEATLVPQKTTTTTETSTSTATATVTKVPEVVPTPAPHTCPTPGTYTFPATTIVVTETTTVCGATSTSVAPGTHTVGGVTTVVKTATTVVCPVATVSTSGSVTTSTIVQTTYVCPSAGTYTIAPITTTVTNPTVIVYPVPTSYPPGTYTAPQTVVTVTETDYIYYCPFTSSGLPTTTPAPAPAPQPTYAPPPAPAPQSSQASPPAPAPQSSQASSPAQSAPPKSGNGGTISATGDFFALTYTPYDSNTGSCKSADEVDGDIAAIKAAGFGRVRLYSTDCNTLENVGNAARKHGVRLIIGIFVKGTGCSYDTPDIKVQVDATAAWGQWDLVDIFVVGNEAIMNGYCSASQLRELVVTVKSKCSGYNGHYTISETLNIWQQSGVASTICDVVDITGANIHAFFNPSVTPDQAGAFVSGQLQLLAEICPGNEAYSLETGWPTQGECNGVACPGQSQQATALKSIKAACGSKVSIFSLHNDMWKNPGAFGCEQYWGSAAAFGISV